MRYSDRQNKFKKAVAALWSYCVATKITPEAVQCVAYTRDAAESSKPRGRVELLALAGDSAAHPDDALPLVVDTSPRSRLSNYQVYCGLPGEKEPQAAGH